MFRRQIIIFLILCVVSPAFSSGQVKVRLFSNIKPESAVFSVVEGEYGIFFNSDTLKVTKGESFVITKYNGKLAVKTRNSKGFICDSVLLSGQTEDDLFSIRVNKNEPVRQYYSGDLQCFPDMETLVILNNCDVEKYVSGVVKAEGGSGKNIEYFKSQAVIARTYMYKYFDKHLNDRYNVCDDTHCQAFNGLSSDSVINSAALETKGLVILDKDSTVIISAFHSNCGGETSASEDVWLTSQPYLRSVSDPYCLTSRNAEWGKNLSLNEWVEYIKKSGFNGNTDDPSVFNFYQKNRLTDYRINSFSMPLRKIRTDLNLRSTFFSLFSEGDSIIMKGRGYGHGVGLCQEGAMEMASKGYNFRQIIDFYYFGVLIDDIKNAVILPPNPPMVGLIP
jgi:stage II sporulation protein D